MGRRRVCVCGGGGLAHALVAVLGAHPEVELRLLTRQPQRWGGPLRGYYRDLVIEGAPDGVSDDAAEVVPGAELVILAVPHVARPEVLEKIAPHLEPAAWVGGFPGFGGFDWVAREVLGDGPTLFGLQRIPYVTRKLAYGREVRITGIRPQLFIASLPSRRVNEVAALLRELLHMPVVPTPNYLNVTLSQSNPVLNPARLYGLFNGWRPGVTYRQRPEFYRDWDEASTRAYCRCDDDLQALCRAIPLDLAYVKPIVQHFEVAFREDLTDRIRGLASLHGRPAPMRPTDGGWVPDPGAYYFTEDVPLGIVIVKAVAELAGVPTPGFDAVIDCAQRIMGAQYLVDGRLCGPQAEALPLPRRFGIDSREELVRRAAA